MLGKIGALGLAVSIAVTGTAFAAENANQGPLAKGVPAGVDKAISWHGHNHFFWVLGGGVVVGGIVLVATGNGHGAVQNCTLPGCTPPTTTTSPTTTSTPTTTTTTTTTTP